MAGKTPPLTAARIQRLSANPGTRSKLPDSALSPALLKQRQQNTRLNAPVTPGSAMTYRDLAHQADTATNVQYGPQEAAAKQRLAASQQTEKDTSGWYDAYLNELRQHQQNTGAINTQSNDAFRNLTGAVGKLGTGVEGTNAQGDASNAASVRQQLLGSFAGLQNETGRNSNTYADTLSHVVGPGQKLSAQAQGARNTGSFRDQLTAIGQQKGAANQKYRADTIASEAKSVLANQVLGLNQTKADTSATNAAGAEGRKYGYTPSEWAAMKPSQRTSVVQANKPKKTPTGYGTGAPGMNKYGYTYDEWTKLSPADQGKARAGKGPKAQSPTAQASDDFYAKYGVKPASQASVSKAQSSIDTAKTWIGTIKQSNPNLTSRDILPLLTRGQPADKKTGTTAIPAQNAMWVQVALDLAGPTHRISNGTADRLHHAGYSVKALGLPSMTGVITSPVKGGAGAGQ